MANFFKINSGEHINRDLVISAQCMAHGDEFRVVYRFSPNGMAISLHATEAEAMKELQTFLRGPRPRSFVEQELQVTGDVRGQVVREVDGWRQIELVVPLPDDAIYLVAYLRMDGVKLLEWTTTAPDCFQTPETPSPESPQSSGSETCQQAGSCQGTCQQQSGTAEESQSGSSQSATEVAPHVRHESLQDLL